MDKSTEMEHRPTPDDFDVYLPWAFDQLTLPGTVVVTRVVQHEYVTFQQTEKKAKPKLKPRHSRAEMGSELAKPDKSLSELQTFEDLPFEKRIFIKTTYDHSENLVQIKFEKCRTVPRGLFKLLTLIMQFHTCCTNITINKGIDNNSLIEITKVISASNVTDLCLDDTKINNAHYHILLEQPNKLRYLSLSRCCITDEQIEKIAKAITYPEPSSTSLMILNLASNKITDVGAKYIAAALRTNRQLAYLNISDNAITDEGAIPIFHCLGEFLLTTDELKDSRTRITNYLRNKTKLVSQFLIELKCGDLPLKPMKGRDRKGKCLPSPKIKKSDKEMSKSNLAGEITYTYDTVLYEKSTEMADAILGEFHDPFSPKETFIKDCLVYSTGNDRLCYLNIAYNSITVLSLKKLLQVLDYQKTDEKKGRGLVNVNLDGNYLPKSCIEMVRINDILQSGMMLSMMHGVTGKKKTLLTSKSKYNF